MELAKRIAERTGQNCPECIETAPDEALGILGEKEGVDIHRLIHNEINKPSVPSPVHKELVKLALMGSNPRIVTTNYDLHLSTCIKEQVTAIEGQPDKSIKEYSAPALPQGDDFIGIVYLHGSIDGDPENLVATDTDFASAYMTRHWASDFLLRMFDTYTVLFVGYSMNDIPMKYMMLGLTPGSNHYSLTEERNVDVLQRREITGIVYTEHADLPKILAEWSRLNRLELTEHRERISKITRQEPLSLSKSEKSYLKDSIADPDRVKFFTETARGLEWLKWVKNLPEFKRIFDQNLTQDDPIIDQLSRWFAESYAINATRTNNQHLFMLEARLLYDEAILTVAQNNNTLNPKLWAYIIDALRNLAPDKQVDPLRRWISLLIDHSSSCYTHHVSMLYADLLLKGCEPEQKREVCLLIFDHLTDPRLKATPHRSATGYLSDNTYIEEFSLSELWQKLYKPNLVRWAQDLVPFIDHNLRQLLLLHRTNKPLGHTHNRINYDRPAIEDNDTQDDQHCSFVNILIDVARDILCSLLSQTPNSIGRLYLQSWESAEEWLLRRIAIHGWIERLDTSSDDKIKWLMETGWMFDLQPRHEVMRMLKESAPQLSQDTTRILVDYIIRGPTDPGEYTERVQYDLLGWLARHATNSRIIRDAFDETQNRHPEWREKDHPDFVWSVPIMEHLEETESEPLESSTKPTMPSSSIDIENLINRLRSMYDHDSIEQQRFFDKLSSLTQHFVNTDNDLKAIDILIQDTSSTNNEADHYIVKHIIGYWISCQADAVDWKRIVAILPRIREFGEKRWPSNPGIHISTGRSILTEAINSWCGVLGELWIRAISILASSQDSEWRHLPDEIADELTCIVKDTNTSSSEYSRVTLVRGLKSLYTLYPNWTLENLLPVLDPRVNHERAVKCWAAFLYSHGYTLKLLEAGLLNLYLELLSKSSDGTTYLSHVQKYFIDANKAYTNHLAAIALYSGIKPYPCQDVDNDTWLKKFIANADRDTRFEWSRCVTSYLRKSTPSQADAQWDSWIRAYWQDRNRSIPLLLNPEEASLMAIWTTTLDKNFPEAVALTLEDTVALVPEDANIPLRSDICLSYWRRIVSGAEDGKEQADPIRSYPKEMTRLFTHLLKNTNNNSYRRNTIKRIIRKFIDRLPDHVTKQQQHQMLSEQALGFGVDISRFQ